MSSLPDTYGPNGEDLWFCRGDCRQPLPREAFGGGKKRNTRCNTDPGHGCEAAYRRSRRKDAKKRVKATGVTITDILNEDLDGKADLSSLTEEQKVERRKAMEKIARYIRELPQNLRELHELETVAALEDANPDQNMRSFFGLGSYLLDKYHYMQAAKFSHIEHTGHWYRKRIAYLKTKVEMFDDTAIKRAYRKERERLTESGRVYSSVSFGHSTYDDPSDPAAAARSLEDWWKGYLKRKKEREKADRAKAKECPTPAEFAKFLAENLWLVDDKAFVDAYYGGFRPGSSVGSAGNREYWAQRAGDTTSARKWRNAVDQCDSSERKYESELSLIVEEYFTTHFSGLDEMPTWAELYPSRFSDEALDKTYSESHIESEFNAELWQQQRWVTLKDDDLESFRKFFEEGDWQAGPRFESNVDYRLYKFYGLPSRWRSNRSTVKYKLPVVPHTKDRPEYLKFFD